MKKEQKVLNYYVICNRLKDVIRTGWKDWNVKRDRIKCSRTHLQCTNACYSNEIRI